MCQTRVSGNDKRGVKVQGAGVLMFGLRPTGSTRNAQLVLFSILAAVHNLSSSHMLFSIDLNII